MQITAKLRNRTVAWSVNARRRVGDTVTYAGDYYSNTSGKNPVPTDINSWVRLTTLTSTALTINKDAGDITGSDPIYSISLSLDGVPAFPAAMRVYVDIEGDGNFLPVDPVDYNPVTKVLNGMSSPTDFPDQLIKIVVI